MTKVGLAIADKFRADTVTGEDGMHASRIHHRIDKGEVPMVHCLTGPFGESGAGATVRPRGM